MNLKDWKEKSDEVDNGATGLNYSRSEKKAAAIGLGMRYKRNL